LFSFFHSDIIIETEEENMASKKSEIKREVFSTRINPALIKELKYLAVDKNKPLNHLIEEAIEGLLKKHKR
jgi:predicted HicB family RNase H-like nuclease